MRKYFYVLPLIALNSLNSLNSFAAHKVLIGHDKAADALVLNSLSDSHAFVEKEVRLPNNEVRYKIKQHYKGVPIWEYSFVSTKSDIKNVNVKNINGEHVSISGVLVKDFGKNFCTAPAISAQEAIKIATSLFNNQVVTNNTESKLLITLDADGTDNERLIYLINFNIIGNEASRPFVIIDAHTGQIIKRWEGLASMKNATGPGGNEKTGKYLYGKDYGFLLVDNNCRMDSPNVVTYNLNGLTWGGSVFKFKCPENTVKKINGAYSPLNDAHYFGNVVYDMYQDWFKVEPLKFKLKMRVHYGNRYENAFWDGTQMTFGDGGKMFYPLVSQDVVGHEVSHGFTEQNSGLVYEGQSGGINEAFSDMAGEATEYYLNKNKLDGQRNDWLVGESILKGPKGSALRYFDDPTRDGSSIGHAKDYYEGMEVHASSGIFNKAFYILAHKVGWDLPQAFKVFVVANQLHWNPTVNFIDAAKGVLKAAQDLNLNEDDVKDAFKQVGIDI